MPCSVPAPRRPGMATRAPHALPLPAVVDCAADGDRSVPPLLLVARTTEGGPMTPEEKLAELGIELKEATSFHPAMAVGVITGNLLYLSGTTPPNRPDKTWQGRVGGTYSGEGGDQAARGWAIQQLAMAKAGLGDLDRVRRGGQGVGVGKSGPG